MITSAQATAAYLRQIAAPSTPVYAVGQEGLIAALRAEGVEVVGNVEQHDNGKFAWILDPYGRKIELWEPVPSKEDPHL